MTEDIEIIVKAFVVHSMDNIQPKNAVVNESNFELVEGRLKYEYKKIINILKELVKIGVIKSIYIPKNRRLKKELENLVKTKLEIKNSLNKINTLFN